MAFLTIAGTAYNVQSTGAKEGAPQVQGATERMFDGTLRTTKRTRKYTGAFTLGPMTESEYQALLADIPPGTFVTVAGDALPSSITAEVEVTEAPYNKIGLGFKRTVGISVVEA